MKLPDEFDEQSRMNASMSRMIIGAIVFVAAILVLVLIINSDSIKKNTGSTTSGNVNAGAIGSGNGMGDTGANGGSGAAGNGSGMTNGNSQTGMPGTGDTGANASGGTAGDSSQAGDLSPEDFDFWDLYPEATATPLPEETGNKKEEEKNDPSTDGRHTLVVGADGKEEWVLISPYLPKAEYDYTKLVCQSGLMKYYEDGRQVSYVGADISKYQDYVDFTKVKKAGIDFVMLRVGARGYGTGQVVLDDYFSENMKRATDAGLEIGLYFFSQAITADEAVEEANLVLDNIGEYEISYPIVFDMEQIANDTSRIDNLTRDEKTKIAKKFLKTIEDAGYKPMLYGNKEWLIKKVDLSKLTDYDIWLSQPGDIPDYPYKFTMWKYSDSIVIDGIAGYASLSISFIDYSEK